MTDDDLFPPDLPLFTGLGEREPRARDWLAGLPALVDRYRDAWSLRLGRPFHGGSCSWVAPARLPDGTAAVFKVTWPHDEAAAEAAGLRLWDGRGAARVLRAEPADFALLLERCSPGGELGDAGHLPAGERLLIGAGVLRELGSVPVPAGHGLPLLGEVTAAWADLAEERMERLRPGYDAGLVALGADLLRSLPASATRQAVVHGDFNPGNVLAAERRPWLAIDAKPMAGDPGYDVYPLLEQIDDPYAYPAPSRVVAERFALLADALEEDAARLQAWAVARRVETALWAASLGDVDGGAEVMAEARLLAELAGV
ncbi:aminoglycoside phosphotransferase family protein [Streptomyces sp. NPDC051940]|uniref:aminoglycoside phosphotransferase family protein n=1 Tax=Streptomyces sp. NPDC051940 TaxID=3155675 RepID=UPI003418B0D3